MRLTLVVAAGLGALAYALFFHGLADRDLWSSHEARAAMDGQSVLGGAALLPRLTSGEPELQKPPLYYWLVALAALPRGEVDAWAVRLPAALAAAGCVLLLAWRGGGRAGVLAAVVLATAVHFTWLARIGRIDMPLTLTTAAAVLAFHRAGQGGGRRWLVVAYVAMASGVMLKGPIGLVLPLAVAVASRFVGTGGGRTSPLSPLGRGAGGEGSEPNGGRHYPPEAPLTPDPSPQGGEGSKTTGLGLWWGPPLVAALVLPWFVWVNVATDGEHARVFFWYHNVTRGLGGSDLRGHPVWFYPAMFAGDFLPWTPLLPAAAWLCWRNGWWRDDARVRLGFVWFVVVLVLLSCARFKRADYLLPAYPGAALFLGATLDRWLSTLRRPRLAWGAFALVAAGTVAGWMARVHVGLPAEEAYRDYRAFAAQVRAHAGDEPVAFFRTEAHALAFRVGGPVVVCRFGDELEALLRDRASVCVVLPPGAEGHLPDVPRAELGRNTELAGGRHERPLVLLRLRRDAAASAP